MGYFIKKVKDGEVLGSGVFELEVVDVIFLVFIEGGESDDEYEDILVRFKWLIEEVFILVLFVVIFVVVIIFFVLF